MAKYVYTGNVVAQTLFDKNDTQNILSKTIIDSILKNTAPNISPRYAPSNVSTDIGLAYSHNYSKKVEQYYKYGKNTHSDGLPSNIISEVDDINSISATQELTAEISPLIQPIIENEIGEAITIHWYAYGIPNPALLAFDYVQKSTEYTINSRHLLYNSHFRFTKGTSGISYKSIRFLHIGTTLTIEAVKTKWINSYADGHGDAHWEDDTSQYYTIILDLSLGNNISNADIVHQVRYTTNSIRSGGAWFYEEDGTYPDLDGTTQVTSFSAGSYPFAMLIEDGKNVNKGAMGEDYKVETNSLLKKIGLDLDTIMDSLNDPTDPTTLNDVKDAFLLYSIDLDATTDASLQYLYEHFRDYYYNKYTNIDNAHQNWVNNNVTNPRTGLNTFRMGFNNARAGFSVLFRWMRITTKTGDITQINSNSISDLNIVHPYVNEIDANNSGNIHTSNGVKVGLVTKQIIIGNEYGLDDSPHKSPLSINSHVLIIRRQLSETTYSEIIIFGLQHLTTITGFAINGKPARGYDIVIVTLADITNNKFFIPLAHQLMYKFNSILRSGIFYESLTVVLHLYTVTKIPWYANPLLWIAVRIILFIATWGSSEGWLQIIWQIVQKLVIDYAVNLVIAAALSLLVDLVGGDIALIIAAIAATYAIVKGGDTKLLKGLMSAEQLMRGATLLVHAVNQSTQDDFLRLQDRQEQHELWMTDEEARLEELEALIIQGVTIDLDSVVTRQPLIDLNENPTDFYNRNVHITNPGVLSLDTIDTYVSTSLVLPEYIPKLTNA